MECRVRECKFFHSLEGSAGFAVMTNKYQFFVVGNSDKPADEIRASKLADYPNSRFSTLSIAFSACME